MERGITHSECVKKSFHANEFILPVLYLANRADGCLSGCFTLRVVGRNYFLLLLQFMNFQNMQIVTLQDRVLALMLIVTLVQLYLTTIQYILFSNCNVCGIHSFLLGFVQ